MMTISQIRFPSASAGYRSRADGGSGHRRLGFNPGRAMLLAVFFLGLSLTGSAFAQESGSQGELDSHVPDEPVDKRPTGIDMMYGGVTIAGGEQQAEEGESSFGLGRMYGGVS